TPLEVPRADSATWTLPVRASWRLSHLHGRWGAESRLVRVPVGHGAHTIGSRRGHTGHQHLPWVALDADGSATEEHGEVYSCALAWSGSWRLTTR
ncbi:alpha-galactosidase, partial [Streptomyces sp. TRM76130]|nr:alpha-galactosidase [Streptomyces sp. TRM76130]